MSDRNFPSVNVAGKTRYVDSTGGLHRTVAEAISANMRVEKEFSRGTSGGCGQDPGNVSGGSGGGKDKK